MNVPVNVPVNVPANVTANVTVNAAGRATSVALIMLMLALFGCASDEPAGRREAPSAKEVAPASGEAASGEPAEPAQTLQMPRTWDEVGLRLEFLCPGPLFDLEETSEVEMAGHRFLRKGSTWVRQPAWEGELVLGVAGAPKDATEATRKNLEKAAARFKKEGVHLVLVNGDLGEDQDLKDVMRMLGEVFQGVPVAVHAGNIEWASAFTNAFEAAHRDHPQLINLNWVRDLDLGQLHLVSLPGYYDGKFARSGACRYTAENLKATRALVHELKREGKTVIFTSHGPPRSKDFDAIDFAHEAGNVGDERITELLLEEDVRFGIFGHILEAGGRATSDIKRGKPLPLPVKKKAERLYVNVGSAGSYPWTMLDGSTSEGMAFIIRVASDGGTAEKIVLAP